VDRLTYRFNEPQRGDVVVFQYPGNPSIYYIKRIIGLPGETVTIKDGIVSITHSSEPKGFVLQEPYVEPNHRSHDSHKVTLGETQYFVMGDNRTQSSDSRVWGPLDEKRIIGRPIVRLLPIQYISLLPGEYHEETTKK